MKFKYTLAAILFLLYNNAFAQHDITWQKAPGGFLTDILTSGIPVNNGGFVLGGYSNSNVSKEKSENTNGKYDWWIISTDAYGNTLWENTIGGSGDEYFKSIAKTADGNYILGGSSNSPISGDKTQDTVGGFDFWIVKLDSAGNLLWQQTIGGNKADICTQVLQTADGGYIAAGYSMSDSSGNKTENCIGGNDIWILKLDSIGNIVWQQTIGGGLDDKLGSMFLYADGTLMLAATSLSNSSSDKTEDCLGNFDYWLLKLDALGNIIWQNTMGGTNADLVTSIQPTADMGFIVSGQSMSAISSDKTENSIGYYDFWVLKFDAAYNLQWQNTIGGDGYDVAPIVKQALDGNYFLTGTSYHTTISDFTAPSSGQTDVLVAGLDSSGNVTWSTFAGGLLNEYPAEFININDTSFVICANSNSKISGRKTLMSYRSGDYWILKMHRISTIAGKLFIDANSNAVLDSNEVALIANRVINKNSGDYVYSQRNGRYKTAVSDTGSYQIAPKPIPYYQASPAIRTIVIDTLQKSKAYNDFAFQPTSVANDLQVSIFPISYFGTSHMTTICINYKNIGTSTISPTIIYYTDTQLFVLNSYPTPNATFSDSLIYYLPPLEPYNDTTIIIEFMPKNDLKPAFIKLKARIEPIANDNNPSDNLSEWIFSEAYNYYGNFAYSPTKIFVDQLNPTPPFIDYVVYFKSKYHKNTYYFSTQNVMAGNLAQHTFELVGSSNPVNIEFNKAGKKMFIEMPHCNLVKSKFAGPRNYAWVHYRLKPKKTLKSGDVITNIINSNLNDYYFYDANTVIVSPPDYFATSIQGDTTACIDTGLIFNYATPLHTGNIYNWTVPNYGSIISGQGTHTIDVKWMAAGSKHVSVIEQDSAMIFIDYDSVKVTISPDYSKVDIVYLWPGDSVFLAGMWQHTPGTYVDSLLSVNGCDSLIISNVVIANGINMLSDVDIQLHPNPASTHTTLTFVQCANKFVTVTIYDNIGKACFNKQLKLDPAGKYNLDINSLTKGIYSIQVKHETKMFYHKLIKY